LLRHALPSNPSMLFRLIRPCSSVQSTQLVKEWISVDSGRVRQSNKQPGQTGESRCIAAAGNVGFVLSLVLDSDRATICQPEFGAHTKSEQDEDERNEDLRKTCNEPFGPTCDPRGRRKPLGARWAYHRKPFQENFSLNKSKSAVPNHVCGAALERTSGLTLPSQIMHRPRHPQAIAPSKHEHSSTRSDPHEISLVALFMLTRAISSSAL
jgi:hypothetical protein